MGKKVLIKRRGQGIDPILKIVDSWVEISFNNNQRDLERKKKIGFQIGDARERLASPLIHTSEQEESGMHDYQGQGVMLEMVVQNDLLSSVGGFWVEKSTCWIVD